MIFDSERSRKEIFPAYFSDLSLILVSHVAFMLPSLLPHIGKIPVKIAGILRGYPNAHIGHQLYNELGGIDRLIKCAPGSRLPDWIVLGRGSELWGPLDKIFPELSGKVRRDLSDLNAVVLNSYEQRTCLVRVVDTFVSKSLRHRVLRAAVATELYSKTVQQVSVFLHEQRPIILLGIRVENRTLVDQKDFFHKLVKQLAFTYPKALLVVDGKNVNDNNEVILSNCEPLAKEQPITKEKELAKHILEEGRKYGLPVVDNVGSSVQESLAWSECASCFISVWGASLAKYRWICNKEGFVVTGRWNIDHRTDLHIYSNASYMEEPTEFSIASQKSVIDRPEIEPLINNPPGHPSNWNFSVVEQQFFQELLTFLNALTSPHRVIRVKS